MSQVGHPCLGHFEFSLFLVLHVFPVVFIVRADLECGAPPFRVVFFMFLFRSSHEGSRGHVKRAQSVCAMTGYLSSKGHLGSCDVSFFLRTDGVVRLATFFFT